MCSKFTNFVASRATPLTRDTLDAEDPMPLELPEGTRFARRNDGDELPREVVSEYDDLMSRVIAQGNRRTLLEHFKGYFCGAAGIPHNWSSDEGWAHTDLMAAVGYASHFPALFLEAFYDACESLRDQGGYELPSVDVMNAILRDHGVQLEIRPPRIVRVSNEARVPVPEPPPSLAESAGRTIRQAIQRAEELLAEDRPREAVQEMLWILESIATAFRGTTLPTGEITGRYFNEIARELRTGSPGTTLNRLVDWCGQLHGYLSSPTGGGVRHGIDLTAGRPISSEEGRLFCNLILSYVTFLMAEHARLSGV